MAKYKGSYKQDLDKEEKPYSEEFQAQAEETPKEESLSNEEKTYKQRHSDLRKWVANIQTQKDKEIQSLKTQLATATQKQIKFPKTDEEIEQWSSKYPEVAKIIDTIAQKRANEASQETEKKLESLKNMEVQITKEKAQNELLKIHPDFARIKSDSSFHDWVDVQPQYIRDALYKNNTDAISAARAIDLYKADLAKEKKQPAKEAATSVGRTGSVKPTGKEKMKFSESQVASMKPHEYEKYEDAILESMQNGTFDYDMRDSAR